VGPEHAWYVLIGHQACAALIKSSVSRIQPGRRFEDFCGSRRGKTATSGCFHFSFRQCGLLSAELSR
jgi:hypothetical protein